MVSRGDASFDCERGKKTPKNSCGISRNKNLLIKGAFVTVCKVSRVISISTVATRFLDLPLLWNAPWMVVKPWCSAQAVVRLQAALISAEPGFYQSAQIIRCRRHKSCDSLPMMWKQAQDERSGRRLCPTRAGLMCWPSGPRARLEKISVDLRVGVGVELE